MRYIGNKTKLLGFIGSVLDDWFDNEPALRGKTGLIPDTDRKSKWSAGGECVAAFRDLISSVNARYVLLSYNKRGDHPSRSSGGGLRRIR